MAPPPSTASTLNGHAVGSSSSSSPSSPAFVIRQATQDDIPVLSEILAEAFVDSARPLFGTELTPQLIAFRASQLRRILRSTQLSPLAGLLVAARAGPEAEAERKQVLGFTCYDVVDPAWGAEKVREIERLVKEQLPPYAPFPAPMTEQAFDDIHEQMVQVYKSIVPETTPHIVVPFLAVTSDSRGLGVVKALIQQVISSLTPSPSSSLSTSSTSSPPTPTWKTPTGGELLYLDATPEARPFYEKLGFRFGGKDCVVPIPGKPYDFLVHPMIFDRPIIERTATDGYAGEGGPR